MFDPAALKNCHHIFEKSAIVRWLQQKNSCPLCNARNAQILSARDLATTTDQKIRSLAKRLENIYQAGIDYKKNHPEAIEEEKEEFISDHLEAYIARRLNESEQSIRRINQTGFWITMILFSVFMYMCLTKEKTPNYYL